MGNGKTQREMQAIDLVIFPHQPFEQTPGHARRVTSSPPPAPLNSGFGVFPLEQGLVD
jgi:hypothetical protein